MAFNGLLTNHHRSNHGNVLAMTNKERADKRLAMAEDLFRLCGKQTAREWQECLDIAFRIIV